MATHAGIGASKMSLVLEPELMEASGHRQRKKLMEYLVERRIPYHIGNNGIWTTQAAIDASLLGAQNNQPSISGLE